MAPGRGGEGRGGEGRGGEGRGGERGTNNECYLLVFLSSAAPCQIFFNSKDIISR